MLCRDTVMDTRISIVSQTSQESEMLSSFSVQHELLHKQIVAFEKLLQHAMNRFSRDKLIHMLKVSDVTLQHAMNRFSRDKLMRMLKVSDVTPCTRLESLY